MWFAWFLIDLVSLKQPEKYHSVEQKSEKPPQAKDTHIVSYISRSSSLEFIFWWGEMALKWP